MTRIAIIVQRYGIEVNGGAELHARLLAEALKPHYEVDVLTSRALDYRVWDRHYPAGEDWVGGCRVLRFDHPTRDRSRAKHMPLRHKLRFKVRRQLARRGRPLVAQPSGNDAYDGLRYLRAQGPTMQGLFDYLRQHASVYDALIFVTALFHPTALGVLVDPARSILVPTLHDEKAMYLPHFHRVFRAPRWIMYNTTAEQKVAQTLYGSDLAPGEVCGIGIELPSPDHTSDAERERRRLALAEHHGIKSSYLLYVGRVDSSKGCRELFDHFARLRRQFPHPLQLVVCGQLFMPRPQHADIVLTGFVSNQERDDLISRAAALVVPSRHESLSLVLLESLAAGCPVIVNRSSDVLRDHVIASGVGETYEHFDDFSAAVQRLLHQEAATRAAQAERARRYVREHYDWQIIVAKYRRVIDAIDTRRTTRGTTDG